MHVPTRIDVRYTYLTQTEAVRRAGDEAEARISASSEDAATTGQVTIEAKHVAAVAADVLLDFS